MKIANFEIGSKIFIVAEIAGNHNGRLELARELVCSAKQAGADAVKFQTYNPEKYIDSAVPPMAHVKGMYKSQQERFRDLQFSPEGWLSLIEYCKGLDILFFSTAADCDSADFLEGHVPVYKIQSGDVTNISLIRHIVKKKKPIIMSVGMATEAEIGSAVAEVPRGSLILLHCTSIYPTPPDKACLMSIPYLRAKFDVPIGYSDHTMNSLASLVAVAMGAVVIERHFTNDKNQPIGDHKFSADFDEFKTMVEEIREIEKMLKGFDNRLSEEEQAMRYVMRRGLSLTRDIPAGTILTTHDLLPLRPEKGIPASKYDAVIGKRIVRNLKKGQFIEGSDISG